MAAAMEFIRSPARLTAPIALVIFAIAALIVVTSTTGGGGGTPTKASLEKQRDLGRGVRTTAGQSKPAPLPPPSYTVHSGDTLSGIAQKTGVSLSKLQQLNPNVKPQALVAGQKLKLR